MRGSVPISVALFLGALCATSPAHAQQATERYIPLDRSPGLSGTYTYIGRVEDLDARQRTLTVAGPAGSREIVVTDRSRIWLDRTQLRLTNQKGTLADCQVGRTVEVKYEDAQRRRFADWIKVRIEDPTLGRRAPER